MALVAAAVCPHPPLLVPQVGVGVDLPARQAALDAVQRLVATDPDLLVVVGADDHAQDDAVRYEPTDEGSFAGYGVDLVVRLSPASQSAAAGDDRPVLPLSLAVGAWLLSGTGWPGDRRGYGVPAGIAPADAEALGARIAGAADRVGLLCMGDGSARRTEKAPGWLDERAGSFDAVVARALADADLEALGGLDPGLAGDLLVAGRGSWQVLAGAARGAAWSAELLVDEAPFGVGYFVASWASTASSARGASGAASTSSRP